MPPSTAEVVGSSVARWLDRHEQRRRSGLPTVSVISGPSESASQAIEQWAHGHGRSLAWFNGSCPTPEDVARGWVERFVDQHDLADEARQWLARQTDGSAEQIARALRLMTPLELAMFLERALPLPSTTGVEAACKLVLLQSVRDVPRHPGGEQIVRGLDSALSDHFRPWLRVLVAMGELMAPDRQPVLFLSS